MAPTSIRLNLIAERFTWGVWLQHPETVRPSDNYLTLLPGVPYDVTITGPAEAVESITLTSLNDWLAKDGMTVGRQLLARGTPTCVLRPTGRRDAMSVSERERVKALVDRVADEYLGRRSEC